MEIIQEDLIVTSNKVQRHFFLLSSAFSIVFVALSALTPQAAAAGDADKRTTWEKIHGTQDSPPLPPYNQKDLRRFDFRVVGKSCATCLHHMQDRMKELPGTLKAAVMLQKPYGAVVIYDSSKVNTTKILDKAKEGLTDVEFEDRNDVPIKSIPLVLVPAAAAKPDEDSRGK